MFGSRSKMNKGAVLMIAIVIASVLSLSIVWFLTYHTDMVKMGTRRREQMRAFYVADIGVQRVLQWFNHPEEYTDNPELFTKVDADYFYESGQSRFTITHNVPISLLPQAVVYDFNNSYLGEMTQLTLLPPDPTNDPFPCIVKVQSTGKALAGPPKTIMVYLDTAQSFDMKSDAAIITEQNAVWGGQNCVYWGPAWAMGDIYLPAISQVEGAYSLDYNGQGITPATLAGWDPWLKIKAKGYVYINNGNFTNGSDNGSKTDTLLPTDSNYEKPWINMATPKQDSKKYQIGKKWIYQHQADLDFAPYDYEQYKDYAKDQGGYYITDEDGKIYYANNKGADGKYIPTNEVDPSTEFKCDIPDADNGPYRIIFIDTVNQLEPATDGSNMCVIKYSGTVPHSKGVFYCANNLDLGGVGIAPSVTNARDPNGNPPPTDLTKVFHQGLLYTSGYLEGAGNGTVYGSCVVKGGYGSSGCPTVYYDSRLKDGTLMPTGPDVRRVLWKTY